MFTGIVQSVGKIESLESSGADERASFSVEEPFMAGVSMGDSIAVQGICLTVSGFDASGFHADVSGETLSCTTFAEISAGARINLEKALTLSSPLGGHLVSGHVDGVATLIKRWRSGRSERFVLEAPGELSRYIACKGSVCVDGVSLTVNAVADAQFELNLVPHTLAVTTLGDLQPGCRVNLEVDIIARYLERLIVGGAVTESSGISRQFLAQHGFGRSGS